MDRMEMLRRVPDVCVENIPAVHLFCLLDLAVDAYNQGKADALAALAQTTTEKEKQ